MKITRRSIACKTSLSALTGIIGLGESHEGHAEAGNGSNLKLAAAFTTDESQLALARSLGIRYCTAWTRLAEENLKELNTQSARQGMTLAYASANNNWGPIVLNLPGRDEAIAEFNRQTLNLGKAGIRNRQSYFYATGVLVTHLVPTPGGLLARAFSANRDPDPRLSYQRITPWPLERKYSSEEIWDNFAYFIRRVAPVAEDANVRISFHPEDPPGLNYFNEPRIIFSSFDGCRRALEIADSPNIGLCLCTGCILEAGQRWGKDIVETIKYFGARKRIFKVHLRNVSSTLPEFHETWLEDGYYDMYNIMKALREVNNDCIISVDHWPGNRQPQYTQAGWVHCMAYAKALRQRADAELAKQSA